MSLVQTNIVIVNPAIIPYSGQVPAVPVLVCNECGGLFVAQDL